MNRQEEQKIKDYFKEFIFGFIFNDIESAIRGKANFLAALGLLCYTEFMGGLKNGEFLQKRGCSSNNFNVFFDFLGDEYKNFRSICGIKVYDIYRCGMAHEYFIKQEFTIYMRGDDIGVEIEENKHYLFIVESYFKDFKKACYKFYNQILKEEDPNILKVILNSDLSGSNISSSTQVFMK